MSRPQRPHQGFGFAINYDREIRNDLDALADIEALIARGLLKPDSVTAGYAFSLIDAALAGGEWLARLEITEDDRHAIAWYQEIQDEEFDILGISRAEPADGWWRRADAIVARICKLTKYWGNALPTLAEAKRARAHAKASLARHRRNQQKYGRIS